MLKPDVSLMISASSFDDVEEWLVNTSSLMSFVQELNDNPRIKTKTKYNFLSNHNTLLLKLVPTHSAFRIPHLLTVWSVGLLSF